MRRWTSWTQSWWPRSGTPSTVAGSWGPLQRRRAAPSHAASTAACLAGAAPGPFVAATLPG
eukprot:5134411-Lingulodinium_polyedra.AAC.1